MNTISRSSLFAGAVLSLHGERLSDCLYSMAHYLTSRGIKGLVGRAYVVNWHGTELPRSLRRSYVDMHLTLGMIDLESPNHFATHSFRGWRAQGKRAICWFCFTCNIIH